jgi:hypothetical protein
MNLIKIKNHVSDSLSSLGLTIRRGLTVNQDIADYIFILTNFLEVNDKPTLGNFSQSTLTFDMLCTSKDETTLQETMTLAYDMITSQEYKVSLSSAVPITTITINQNAEDTDPSTGINTMIITVQLQYITVN